MRNHENRQTATRADIGTILNPRNNAPWCNDPNGDSGVEKWGIVPKFINWRDSETRRTQTPTLASAQTPTRSLPRRANTRTCLTRLWPRQGPRPFVSVALPQLADPHSRPGGARTGMSYAEKLAEKDECCRLDVRELKVDFKNTSCGVLEHVETQDKLRSRRKMTISRTVFELPIDCRAQTFWELIVVPERPLEINKNQA